MKKGFDRLRGVAAASAIGVGLLGGGSARAVTVTTPLSVTRGSASWTGIGNSGASTSSCMGTTSITTTGGFSLTSSNTCFAIYEASLSTGLSDFYDGGMSLVVGDAVSGHVIFANPDGDVDLTVDTLTTDLVVDIIPGIDAQIEYYFDPARAVVRGVYTLTNTSGAEITTSALVMGNYGSDDDTTVQATDSGDLVVTDADKWVVTDDNGVGFGPDPTATIAIQGSGATVTPKTVMTLGSPSSSLDGTDNYGYRYDLTIPAGATCRIMVFNEMSTSIAAATLGAADFESLLAANAAGLLTGLTMAEQDTIVNYAAGTACTAAAAPPVALNNDCCNDNDGIFALGVPGLLGALGSLLLFRRRDTKNRH